MKEMFLIMISQCLLQRSNLRCLRAARKAAQDRSHTIIFTLYLCFDIAQNSIKIRSHYTEYNQNSISEEILYYMNEKVINCVFQCCI